MGFLERAIRRGVSNAVGNAVGNAVQKAVEPAATNLVNQAAQSIDKSTNSAKTAVADNTSGLEGAMANLERSVQGYATEAAKSTKICSNCGKPNGADKKFCSDCGTKLPEQNLAQGAMCTDCGTQNNIGTKFCQNCGAKLPATIQEEELKAQKNAAVMTEWDEKLAQYPKWTCGGTEISIEDYGNNSYMFNARFNGNSQAAQRAVEEYRQILLQNGFRQAGQYPSIQQLFKRIDGIVYNADTEHCFEGDPDCACIGFYIREPYGGFDYVKPEPKKKTSFRDLLGL